MFELRAIVGFRSTGADTSSRNEIIYSRHGGAFKIWWIDERRQNIPIQIDCLFQLFFQNNYSTPQRPTKLRFSEIRNLEWIQPFSSLQSGRLLSIRLLG